MPRSPSPGARGDRKRDRDRSREHRDHKRSRGDERDRREDRRGGDRERRRWVSLRRLACVVCLIHSMQALSQAHYCTDYLVLLLLPHAGRGAERTGAGNAAGHALESGDTGVSLKRMQLDVDSSQALHAAQLQPLCRVWPHQHRHSLCGHIATKLVSAPLTALFSLLHTPLATLLFSTNRSRSRDRDRDREHREHSRRESDRDRGEHRDSRRGSDSRAAADGAAAGASGRSSDHQHRGGGGSGGQQHAAGDSSRYPAPPVKQEEEEEGQQPAAANGAANGKPKAEVSMFICSCACMLGLGRVKGQRAVLNGWVGWFQQRSHACSCGGKPHQVCLLVLGVAMCAVLRHAVLHCCVMSCHAMQPLSLEELLRKKKEQQEQESKVRCLHATSAVVVERCGASLECMHSANRVVCTDGR